MPYYSDYGMYYSGGPYSVPPPPFSTSPYAPLPSPYSSPYSRIMSPVVSPSSSYSSPVTPRTSSYLPSRYTPMLSTITETPFSATTAGRYSNVSSLMRINSPKLNLHSSPKYVAPRPIRVNTADIDVSAARYQKPLPTRVTPSRAIESKPVVDNKSKEASPPPPPPPPANPISPEETHFMPRCDESDAPTSPAQNNHKIKRDRTIVRISTVRQRSKGPSEIPALANETGPPRTPVIVVDVSNVISGQDNAKRTWRDNFGEDLLIKSAKEAPRKTPGELLLERHLIKSAADSVSDDKRKTKELSGSGSDSDEGVGRRGNNRRKNSGDGANKLRRPSFHDICQDISSDKIESVDDLNAGELRRRASLLPDDDEDGDGDEEGTASEGDESSSDDDDDEKVDEEGKLQSQSNNGQFQVNSGETHDLPTVPEWKAVEVAQNNQRAVNKVTKSASGTLHCLLERHLHNNNLNESPENGSRRKTVKRVHHKITAKVHIDEPTTTRNSGAILQSPSPSAIPSDLHKTKRQLNATVEHVSEDHHVNHVLSLPGRNKKQDSLNKFALPKTITRTKKSPEKDGEGEEDFWSVLGTRETIYYNKRRQEVHQKRLQTCTEDSEEVQQFQESILSESPQSPTVEQKKSPALNYEEVDVLHEVKNKKTPKKMLVVAGKSQTKTTTTTVAEKSERCEKNKNGDLKITAIKTALETKTTTTTTNGGSAAKSPETQQRQRRVIDSHHEEAVQSLKANAVAVRGEDRNKQTPVSSINTFTTTNTTLPTSLEQQVEAGDNVVAVAREDKSSTTASEEHKEVTAKSPATSQKVKRTKRSQLIEGNESKQAPAPLMSSSSLPTPVTAKKKKVIKSSSSTSAGRGEAETEKTTTNVKSPSVGDALKTIGKSSCHSSEKAIASATTKSSKASDHPHQQRGSSSSTSSGHEDAPEDQSIPGSLSKFPTIADLNLLSVDIDQPTTHDAMAIEISVSRAHKTDPATAAFSSPLAATITPSESNSGDAMDKTPSVSVSSSVSSQSASLSKSISQSPSLSPSPSPSKEKVKKKRIVLKRVVKKKFSNTPAELSESDIMIGNMSVVPNKRNHNKSSSEEGDDILIDDLQCELNVHTIDEEAEDKEGAEEAPKETIQELIRRVKGKNKKPVTTPSKFDPQKCQKFTPDSKIKLFTVDEKAPKTLWATPRPLQKKPKKLVDYSSDEERSSEQSGNEEENEEEQERTASSATESDDATHEPQQPEDMTLNLYGHKDMRLSSTCSNDSGFEGGTAPSSPKNMLGAHEPRDSPSTPPSHNPAYKIDSNHDELDTSYTYAQYQRSGRITAPATSIPRFRKYTVEDFHFLAVLGKGSFGKVLLAELRNTEYYYAVKCLKKDVVLEDDDVECTLIERKVLALGTKHPYLCHLFCTFQTESHLFFVMEYLNGGDLMFHIQTSGRFPESRARFYAAEIVSGLKFLHKKGIVYRDLKLDNVLLDFDGHVRIADFGMCKLQIYLDRTADSFCGTPDYMAPEIIKGQNYNQTVDWWSFGVLLYEMLIGQSPFSGCDEDELFWSICNETPWIPAYLSKEATNILKALLEKDASIRLGSAQSPLGDIMDHRFFHNVNWQKLERRELDPPFKPAVRHPLDTQYFDQTFTKERVRLTPIQKEILHSMDQENFQGFSYTNPNATLT